MVLMCFYGGYRLSNTTQGVEDNSPRALRENVGESGGDHWRRIGDAEGDQTNSGTLKNFPGVFGKYLPG